MYQALAIFRKVTLINHIDKPCNEDINYSMSQCVADYIDKVLKADSI